MFYNTLAINFLSGLRRAREILFLDSGEPPLESLPEPYIPDIIPEKLRETALGHGKHGADERDADSLVAKPGERWPVCEKANKSLSYNNSSTGDDDDDGAEESDTHASLQGQEPTGSTLQGDRDSRAKLRGLPSGSTGLQIGQRDSIPNPSAEQEQIQKKKKRRTSKL
ncbi:hypothetical protein BX600DRAFT_429765 [Xylariales sp. PMI_506]|nr:hypothetical protein BX600DRAFT_429765 [Xylariales sp. PMI_506]